MFVDNFFIIEHLRSPEELLKEIILVDDASDMDHLKDDLANYMSQYPKVRLDVMLELV